MSAPMVRASSLGKVYPTPRGDLTVFAELDLELPRGSLTAVVGASGTGKSTLLHILGTLDRPTSGTVAFEGEDVFQMSSPDLARFRNRTVGFVFQFHYLLPELDALENVILPGLMTGRERYDLIREGRALLERVGLQERAEHRPAELSGGEQQRVAVARALINQPSVLLADEPSGNLDGPTGDGLHELLKGLVKETGQTTVVATHNDRLAGLADAVYRLREGRLHRQG